MEQRTTDKTDEPQAWRGILRQRALVSALAKRAAKVPTYSVPEAAALLSISQEYLYRLIQDDGFPAVRMGTQRRQGGRYVVPAGAVEKLLARAEASGSVVQSADFTADWRAAATAGTGQGA